MFEDNIVIMRQKIYVRKVRQEAVVPKFISKGEWVDLRAYPSHATKYTKDDFAMIPLGLAMKLPDGFEANIVSRSSTFKNFGFIQVNSYGIIDNSYSGNNDEWKDPVYFLKKGIIASGDRVCQFRLNLSQKATIWQKIKWLFTSGFEFVEVESLRGRDRGGFGSTGNK